MKKVVRLTESDLIKIVKKVIQEDENGFTFGDKVRPKLDHLFMIGKKEIMQTLEITKKNQVVELDTIEIRKL